jgi:hypothetical protein
MSNNKPWLKKASAGKEIEVMGAKIKIKELSFGDSRKAIQGAVRVNPLTKQPELDQSLAGILRSLARIESWDLTDENDKPMPVNLDTIDSLDESFVSELIQEMDKEDDSSVSEEEGKQ